MQALRRATEVQLLSDRDEVSQVPQLDVQHKIILRMEPHGMSDDHDSPGRPRGRLAEVIATRGGQAPPEAPFVIEHREALIYILCQA